MALHDGLLTKAFLKGRDLIQSEKCPREGCGGTEDVKHVLWECDYAQKVRLCFEEFVDIV